VLSVGPVLARGMAKLSPGTVLTLSTATSPDLRGARTALSGGPVLVQGGRVQRSRALGSDSTVSYSRRHPRSAIGWGKGFCWLVQVDGRQRRSVGMTLPELGELMRTLGCDEAMNLDGGGSATFWYDGQVRNNPCDGDERDIANSIAVVRKSAVKTELGVTP
jgi:exopolysaccharide biosynthesis protein